MLSAFLLLLSLLSATWALPSKRWSSPVVDLDYGSFQGVYNETTNIQYFLGVPFAGDVSGSNRWKAPQSPTKLQGLQMANEMGPVCPQTAPGSAGAGPKPYNATLLESTFSLYNENCLTLNVYLTPGANQSDSLPVLVNIHGGGYAIGRPNTVAQSIPILTANFSFVLVDIHYRLGPFGFLAGSQVGDSGVYNAGLLDQQAALKWVNKYISKFGGDPNHVTIEGISAGAGSVLHHVVANGGQTVPALFEGTMAFSVFSPSEYNATDAVVQDYYYEFATAAGCEDASDSLSCLRQADIDTLIAAAYQVERLAGFGNYVFTPVVDGTFIQERPEAALQAGKMNGKYAYANHNLNEGIIYGGLGSYTAQVGDSAGAQAAYIANLLPNLNASAVAAIQNLYSAAEFNTLQNATQQLYGELIFGCPALRFAEAFSKYKSGGHLSVYGYGPSNHGSDSLALSNVGVPAVFSQAWIHNFASFASTYNVSATYDGSSQYKSWPEYTAENPVYVNFNTSADMTAEANTLVSVDQPYLNRCNYWLSISAVIPQ